MAPIVDQTRLYLRTNPTTFRSLAWFRNNKPNEMLMGLYGLHAKQPMLRYMWPERELMETELANVRYDYDEKALAGYRADHFTCHADGKFHLKTVDHKELYTQEFQHCTPLGPDTGVFLDVILSTDRSENYCLIRDTPKNPFVWLDASHRSYLSIRAMFSGANHNLEGQFAATLGKFAGITTAIGLASGTIKGVFAAYPMQLSRNAQESRPRGTIISFKFPSDDNRWHVKAFLFD